MSENESTIDFAETQFAAPAKLQGTPYGVVWRGPWEHPADSFGQATRRMVNALEQAGMPVFLPSNYSIAGGQEVDVEPEVFLEMGRKVDEKATAERREKVGPSAPPVFDSSGPIGRHLDRNLATVYHVLPLPQVLHRCLYPHKSEHSDPGEVAKLHRYMVAMTALERDRVDADTADMLRRFGQVWVPCQRNKKALEDSGVTNAHVVPHPVDERRAMALYEAKTASRSADFASVRPFIFYHIGKWEPRKNQHSMLRAFLRAFTPATNVVFLLKTSKFFAKGKGYPDGPTECIQALLADPLVAERGWTAESAGKAIRVNDKREPESHMVKLHAYGHAYVNVSHGEAWDLPAYDALCVGNQLIHTGFGGSEDYVSRNHPRGRVWQETDGTEVCHAAYRWGNARWARVNEDKVVEAMQEVFAGRGVTPPSSPLTFPASQVGVMSRQLLLQTCGLSEGDLRAFG